MKSGRCLGVDGGVMCAAPWFLLLVLGAGCTPGIAWRDYPYGRVRADAQRDDRLMFVYFRNWYSKACTNFEEDVLSDPAVLAATKDLYCLRLDRDTLIDRPLAERWGIQGTPGYVILNPEERVLASAFGEISIDRLLIAIASSEKAHARAQAARREAEVPERREAGNPP